MSLQILLFAILMGATPVVVLEGMGAEAKLTAILTYHIVPGKVMAADVVKMKKAKTVEGSDIKIRVKADKVMVNKARVVKTDVMASNGVIHVVDAVLMPPAKKMK